MFQENSLEACILSRVKQITSPGWMHETSAQTWCSGKTWRERVGREVGGGIGMGKTCEPKAFSFQCMTKFTTKKKKSRIKTKFNNWKKKKNTRRRAWPCGAPAHKAFVSPLSLIPGNSLHSASMTFPDLQWADSSGCQLGKEGIGKPEKQSRGALG